ncbi:MAG: TrkA family potassium uptake protein [Alphaproteobacteria bacterium]|nr:TrkA family potassium uptake protein [Alphaproteobacteria bacterium]
MSASVPHHGDGPKQALVVGLGQFGMALARSLVEHGTEVVAVDRRADRVQLAAAFATEAVEADAMDETGLARFRPAHRDLCVCAIGQESREASIIVTAMLKQMGAPHLIARATDELHERILLLVGAHEVLNPERILGERLAARLAHQSVLDTIPLGDDLHITELSAAPSLRGRTLAQLELPRRHELTVLGVRRGPEGHGRVLRPGADLRIEAGDVLIVVGPPEAARRFAEER